jgi:hypothetical protein
MGVDRESSEGVVYIKTLSTEDAGKVFRSVISKNVHLCFSELADVMDFPILFILFFRCSKSINFEVFETLL